MRREQNRHICIGQCPFPNATMPPVFIKVRRSSIEAQWQWKRSWAGQYSQKYIDEDEMQGQFQGSHKTDTLQDKEMDSWLALKWPIAHCSVSDGNEMRLGGILENLTGVLCCKHCALKIILPLNVALRLIGQQLHCQMQSSQRMKSREPIEERLMHCRRIRQWSETKISLFMRTWALLTLPSTRDRS